MHLFHQMVSLRGIYASRQSCIVVPLIQDFPTQKELACHTPNEFLLIVCGLRQVFTIFDVSLDIMVPWLPIDFNLNVHTFFNIHEVGRHVADLYAQLSHIVSFYQLNHASQGGQSICKLVMCPRQISKGDVPKLWD